MDYKEAYVREVGLHLPEKMRVDIQSEIRSLIEDTLDDRAQAEDRPADEEMLLAVLRKLGPPEKVAASYLPPRYLIGPELYPTFIMVVRIVVTVIVILSAVGMGVSLAAGAFLPREVLETIGAEALELLGSVVSAVGSIVIVFAVIQRFNPNFKPDAKPWDPRTMKPAFEDERVKIGEAVPGIIFNVLILAVLFVYPEWLGISNLRGGQWVHAPLVSVHFFGYLPWMALILTAEIVHNALLLGAGRWTPTLRWFAIAIAAATLGLGIVMLTGPSITRFDPEAFVRLGFNRPDLDTIARITEGLELAARMIIGIVTALQFVEIGKHLLRLFQKRLPELQVGNS